MKKIIKISGSDYTIKSSAYTQFKYKNDTGRNLLSDLQQIKTKTEGKSDDELIPALDDMLDIVLRITYVMIEEAGAEKIGSFEDFLKSIDNLMEDTQWLADSIEVAVAPLSGGTKKASPQVE